MALVAVAGLLLRSNRRAMVFGALAMPQLDDLNDDFLNYHTDFVLFKSVFDSANGLNSFAAMLTSVPEPDTITLLLVAAILGTPMWGHRRLAILARIGS